MILNNSINAGNFIYCMANWSTHEKNTYLNSGDGHYHQFGYIVDGHGIAEISNTQGGTVIEFNDTNQPGALIDLSHSKDMYHTTTTTDSTLTMMLFNPIPATRNLKVEILTGPITKTISADTNRIVIVCITGPVTANDKTLESLQHAKIFPGKTVELTLPENTVCALVSE